MNKCEWKDGKFEPCDKFDWNVIEYNLTSGSKMKKCYHCHGDIRRPGYVGQMPVNEELTLEQQKTVEQIKRLQIQNEKELGNLISKDIIQEIFQTMITALKRLNVDIF